MHHRPSLLLLVVILLRLFITFVEGFPISSVAGGLSQAEAGTSVSALPGSVLPGDVLPALGDNVNSGNSLPVWTAWFKDVLSLLLSWPVVVLILFLYLMKSSKVPQRIGELFKPFRSLRVWGTELILNEEVAKTAEEAFEAYRKQIQREYDRRTEAYGLRQKLQDVVEIDINPFLGDVRNTLDFRSTVHVPDVLFEETLYQILDYYPKGGGRGRTWSVRYGIIGKTWRLAKSQIEGAVPTTADDLILNWGMTREEASAAGQGRKSFAAIVLRDDEQTPVGIFYLDSTRDRAFDIPGPDKLEECVVGSCKTRGLTAGLAKIYQELRSRGALVHIHG